MKKFHVVRDNRLDKRSLPQTFTNHRYTFYAVPSTGELHLVEGWLLPAKDRVILDQSIFTAVEYEKFHNRKSYKVYQVYHHDLITIRRGTCYGAELGNRYNAKQVATLHRVGDMFVGLLRR